MSINIQVITKRWAFARGPMGWSLMSKVTGELVLWKGMFGLQRVSKRPFRNFIRCIQDGWKLWFFGDPWDCREVDDEIEYADTDDFVYRDGGFKAVSELPF